MADGKDERKQASPPPREEREDEAHEPQCERFHARIAEAMERRREEGRRRR